MSNQRSRTLSDQRERELLADIVDSPGWNIFVERIVKVLARQRMQDSLANVQRGDIAKAQSALASSQAVLECVLGAYEGSGVTPPESLQHQTGLIHEES